MSFNPTAFLADILPNSTDLAQNIITGAAASVVLAGLKSSAGLDAIDPLHLIHPVQPSGAPGGSTVVGKSITAAAFASLPPATQQMVLGQGYVIAG